jgi:hypothetical protein
VYDVPSYCEWLRGQDPHLEQVLTDELVARLDALSCILRPFGLHFGKRTIRELALYLRQAALVGAAEVGLDDQVVQKILPKVSGTEDHAQMLAQLAVAVADLPNSAAAIARLQDLLARTGAFKV